MIPDAIPAIITPEVFDRVQKRCEQNQKAPAHTRTNVNYMLTTKLFCRNCGCCFSERMRKLFRKNEKNVLRFCNKKAKEKRRLQRVKKPM